MIRIPFIFALGLLVATTASADYYHYRELLIGERAAGMGGAYVAISEDPSGLFHNPAGTIFGMEDYLSVSANAYNSSTETYEDIRPGQNYVYRSQGLIPALFAVTQTYGKQKVGFALIVPNSDSVDQADQLSFSNGSMLLNRKVIREDTTYLFGPGYSREIAENFSLGVSLMGVMRMEKRINTMFIRLIDSGDQYVTQSAYYTRTGYAFAPKLGLQFMPSPNWSFGFTVSKLINIGGSGSYQNLQSKLTPGGQPATPDGKFTDDMTLSNISDFFHDLASPLTASFGIGYFPSKSFLVTLQIDGYGAQSDFAEYPIEATYNWSLGSEIYLQEWLALRGGIFSNNANTPVLDANGTNQPPHVDMLGATLGGSFYRAGTSLTAGVIYSTGSGFGQAISETPGLNRVKRNSVTVYLSGSYQL